jgi:hypothetical protein
MPTNLGSLELSPLSGRIYLALRLLLCFASAVVVFITSYLLYARYHYLEGGYYGEGQHHTLAKLQDLRSKIEAYRQINGKLPAKPDDLAIVYGDGIWRFGQDSDDFDVWGRLLQYRVTDDGYELFSYGRDGKPGGTGPDADLYLYCYETSSRWGEKPTFWQYLTAARIGNDIQVTCLLAGVFAFLLGLSFSKGWPGQDRYLEEVLALNFVTAACCILFAIVVNFLISR